MRSSAQEVQHQFIKSFVFQLCGADETHLVAVAEVEEHCRHANVGVWGYFGQQSFNPWACFLMVGGVRAGYSILSLYYFYVSLIERTYIIVPTNVH